MSVPKHPELREEWYGSQYNFAGMADAPIRKAILHDVTLRDGEQHVGVLFTKEEKMEIAVKLAELGVHRIEVAMPAVSQDDRDTIKAIAKANLGPTIVANCRAMKIDVDYSVDCGVTTIGMGCMVNDQYLRTYNWALEKSLENVIAASKYAGEQGLKVILNILDVSRLRPEQFLQVANTIAEYGHVDVVGLMDTFGLFSPVGIANFLGRVQKECTRPLEGHFHNDFGLATATSLAALSMGVETIDVSVNGLGERIGNTPLEELVMSLEVLYDFRTGLNLKALNPLSELVQRISRVKMPTCKPVVGEGLRTIESGLVATEYLRLMQDSEDWEPWLFPFLPQAIGKQNPEIVLGKMSGMGNIEWKLIQKGIELNQEQKTALVDKVKGKAIAKHWLLTDDEFLALVNEVR